MSKDHTFTPAQSVPSAEEVLNILEDEVYCDKFDGSYDYGDAVPRIMALYAAQPPATPVTDGSIQEGDILSYEMTDGVGKVTSHVRPPAAPVEIRWARPGIADTLEEMRASAWRSGLADIGDTILIWVNEGDFWHAMMKGVKLIEFKSSDGQLGEAGRAWVVADMGARPMSPAGVAPGPSPQCSAATAGEAIEFEYTNWEGRKGIRQAVPISIRFGKSEWHPVPQWLLLACDIDRQAEREFAMSDMQFEDGILPGIDLVTAQPQGAWQSIATAPHETKVLLGWFYEGEWECETGFASHGWTRNGVSTMSRHGQATHWQPLPSPLSRPQHSGETK